MSLSSIFVTFYCCCTLSFMPMITSLQENIFRFDTLLLPLPCLLQLVHSLCLNEVVSSFSIHPQCSYDGIFAFFLVLFLLGFSCFALFNQALISFHSCKFYLSLLKHLSDIAKKGRCVGCDYPSPATHRDKKIDNLNGLIIN